MTAPDLTLRLYDHADLCTPEQGALASDLRTAGTTIHRQAHEIQLLERAMVALLKAAPASTVSAANFRPMQEAKRPPFRPKQPGKLTLIQRVPMMPTITATRPARLEFNNTGAWKMLGLFDASHDLHTDMVLNAAEDLVKALHNSEDPKGCATMRVTIDNGGCNRVLLRWSHATGWVDAETGEPS